jgi:hypothetical protein
MLGEPDRPHTALADLLKHPIRADLGAHDHRSVLQGVGQSRQASQVTAPAALARAGSP